MADVQALADAARALLNAVERVDQPHRPQRIAAAAAQLRFQLEEREEREQLLAGPVHQKPAGYLVRVRDNDWQLYRPRDVEVLVRNAEGNAGGHGAEADRG